MKDLRKKIENRLEKFGYGDDYIVQTCAEMILDDSAEIEKIIERIEDDGMTFNDAIRQAMEAAEESRYANDMSVSEYIASYYI